MSKHDYLHQLPNSEHAVAKHTTVLRWLHIDPILLLILGTLITVGGFVLFSASEGRMATVNRQFSHIGVGVVAMLILAQLSPRFYKRWTPWVYGLGILLLIAVLVLGAESKGAQRWLAIPGLPRFQPSEVMKLAVPMMVAWFLSERVLPASPKALLIATLLIAVPVVLIAKQPDLGTSILIGSSGLIVLFLAGLDWRLIASLLGASVPLLGGLWFVMHDYQKQRVLTFLNPESDPLGHGWNIIQSKIAIGSGGLDGKGWLNGTQSHLDFLPESRTDFIIAVYAEEFGLIGVLGLLLIYLLIIARGLSIALQAQDTFSRLLAGAITLTFFVYVFVNIGMVSGLLPVVGVPLPLVSYGGTSVVTLLGGFGLLMSIHSHRSLVSK